MERGDLHGDYVGRFEGGGGGLVEEVAGWNVVDATPSVHVAEAWDWFWYFARRGAERNG